jgi:hypothetical protein
MIASMKSLRARLKNDPSAGERLRRAAAALEPSKAKRLSALLDLYQGEKDRLLNFRGPAGTISNKNYWSFIKVDASASIGSPAGATCPVPLEGLTLQPLEQSEQELQNFQGKLVLVGATQNPRDIYETAFSPQVSGVDILANALGDLAEGKSMRTALGEISIVLSASACRRIRRWQIAQSWRQPSPPSRSRCLHWALSAGLGQHIRSCVHADACATSTGVLLAALFLQH